MVYENKNSKKGLLLGAIPILNLAPNCVLNSHIEHSVMSNYTWYKIMSSLKKPCHDTIQSASSNKEIRHINH